MGSSRDGQGGLRPAEAVAAREAGPLGAARPDVVIVGAGIGGLVCGAVLARHGVRPLLLERTEEIGGRARSLRIGEHRVDYGAHLWCNQFMPSIRAAAGLEGYRVAAIPRAESLRIFAEGEGGRPFVYPGRGPSRCRACVTSPGGGTKGEATVRLGSPA